MTQNTKDAVPTQTLAEQAETLQRVYDLVGMGALARTPGILLTNLENMKRRSDCLSGIEQLFTYEVPDDDMPDEMIDECDLNWGQCRAEYVETFKAALPAFIARHTEYAPTAEQAEGLRASLSERLIAAIEGECDGLAITDEQASNVLAYLQYGSPLDDVRRDAERYRKLRDADINAIHKGGVFAGLTPDNVVINGEDLDIAVDLLIDAPAASTGEQESSDGL